MLRLAIALPLVSRLAALSSLPRLLFSFPASHLSSTRRCIPHEACQHRTIPQSLAWPSSDTPWSPVLLSFPMLMNTPTPSYLVPLLALALPWLLPGYPNLTPPLPVRHRKLLSNSFVCSHLHDVSATACLHSPCRLSYKDLFFPYSLLLLRSIIVPSSSLPPCTASSPRSTSHCPLSFRP